MKSDVTPNANLTAEEAEIIRSLLKYPALEKVFDGAPGGFAKTREKMTATVADLERVMRRGAREDAEKAAVIIAAYQTALGFLDEIEVRRKQVAK